MNGDADVGGGEGPCFCNAGWCEEAVQKCGPGSHRLALFYIVFIMTSSMALMEMQECK